MTHFTPIEIWVDIAEYDYDVWCGLRSLNKLFLGFISACDISGKFNYVYVTKNGKYDQRMNVFFKRLHVINEGENQMITYENGIEMKIYDYDVKNDENGQWWKVSSMMRIYCHNNNTWLHEWVGFDAMGLINYCNRGIRVNNEDIVDVTYKPTIGEIIYFNGRTLRGMPFSVCRDNRR